MISCFTQASERLKRLVHDQLKAQSFSPARIVIKPNWVLHQTDSAFPIRALVTDCRVIEAVVEACLELYPSVEKILVGDCPLQYADWALLCEQSGLAPIMERLKNVSGGKVEFRDLRKEVYRQNGDSFLSASDGSHGDPLGYREVELGTLSHLEGISDQAELFAVNDYSSSVTSSNHLKGCHRYYVSQSVLDCDLFINLPKWKSHQKSGITCALKNLVGINGDKAYLPHFRKGAPKWGGDEFRDENRWLYWMQTRLRERIQKRNRIAYNILKPGWELIKRLRGIETRLADPHAAPRQFYIAGGAWHGNDTIWRMIYDLNLIIQCCDREGSVKPTAQRKYYCIVDGLVSGEGNGPLQPLPLETDWLVCGDDPFAIDAGLSWFMGFDPQKVTIAAKRAEYGGPDWGAFELGQLETLMDGNRINTMQSDINFQFAPPPGWRNFIER